MGNDLFGYDAKYQGIKIVRAKEMIFTVGTNKIGKVGTKAGNYLVQNVQLTYQQSVQFLHELSTANAYYLTGPPMGSVSFDRIIGGSAITDFLGAAGQGVWTVPGAGTSAIAVAELQPITGAAGPTYNMYGCIVLSFQISTDANQGLVPENVQMQFGSLEIK